MARKSFLVCTCLLLLAGHFANTSSDETCAPNNTLAEMLGEQYKKHKSKVQNGGSSAIENLASLAIPVPKNKFNKTGADEAQWTQQGWGIINDVLDFWMTELKDYFNMSLPSLQKAYARAHYGYVTWVAYPNDTILNAVYSGNDTEALKFNPETPNGTFPPNVTDFVIEDFDWYALEVFRNSCYPEETTMFGTKKILPDWEKAMQNFIAGHDQGEALYKVLHDGQTFVKDKMNLAYFRIVGAYMGVGWRPSCMDNINKVLEDASEWDKAGASAATTLMALIPALLTFGNLFVPRSSEVFGTSFFVGLMSAVFSFGLPVRSISGFTASRKKQHIDVGQFGVVAKDEIHRLGKRRKQRSTEEDAAGQNAENFVELEKLQQWSGKPQAQQDLDKSENTITVRLRESDLSTFPRDIRATIDRRGEMLSKQLEACENSFWGIQKQTTKWKKRAHFWRVPALIICCLQAALFALAIGPLFLGFGTPLLLFDCQNYWTSLWLLVSAGISGVTRLLMWERGSHERVMIWDLSDRAKEKLTKLFVDVKPESIKDNKSRKGMRHTTETELPPLYAAPEMFMRLIFHLVWSRIGCKRTNKPKQPSGPDIKQEIIESVRFIVRRWWKRTLWPIKNCRCFLKAGHGGAQWPWVHNFEYWKTQLLHVHNCARRYRPLVVLMHLSTSGRNPLATLFTGLVEGLVLILFTIFLGAQWGGNLFVVCYKIAVLLIVVTAGRALGLWYVLKSTSIWGLHVLECETPRDIQGCLRIMCSMKGVLVFVYGAYYFEGYRLDVRDGWREWILEYEDGMYDEGPSKPVLRQHNTGTSSSSVSLLQASRTHTSHGSLFSRPTFSRTVTDISLRPLGATGQKGPATASDYV